MGSAICENRLTIGVHPRRKVFFESSNSSRCWRPLAFYIRQQEDHLDGIFEPG